MRESTAPGGVGRRRPRYRHLAILAVAVVALTVTGPFGTFQDLRPLPRLAYWGGLIGIGTVLFHTVAATLFRMAGRHGVRWPVTAAGLVLTVAAAMTAVVAGLEARVRGNDFLTPAGYAELYVYVLVITLLVAPIPLWLELRAYGVIAPAPAPRPAPPAEPEPAEPEPAEPPFLARIPARLGRDLLALEMEDHYVRAHTRLGSDLILMRLRDAMAELAGCDGLQVHRSHWVAAGAVTGAERRGDGKLTLVLADGRRVPVSRRFTAAVRAAGWINREKHTEI